MLPFEVFRVRRIRLKKLHHAAGGGSSQWYLRDVVAYGQIFGVVVRAWIHVDQIAAVRAGSQRAAL